MVDAAVRPSTTPADANSTDANPQIDVARVNELLPAEHIEHVVFDPLSAKNLLATLAFHGAFGRNGERMTRTLDELKSSLLTKKNQFESLSGTTEAARKAQAAERGIDYASAKRAAARYRDVMGLQEALKGQFGFSTQAGVLGDMRTGLEVLHFITGQTVNNPKTAFLNLLQPAQRALVQRSLGVEQAVATGAAMEKALVCVESHARRIKMLHTRWYQGQLDAPNAVQMMEEQAIGIFVDLEPFADRLAAEARKETK